MITQNQYCWGGTGPAASGQQLDTKSISLGTFTTNHTTEVTLLEYISVKNDLGTEYACLVGFTRVDARQPQLLSNSVQSALDGKRSSFLPWYAWVMAEPWSSTGKMYNESESYLSLCEARFYETQLDWLIRSTIIHDTWQPSWNHISLSVHENCQFCIDLRWTWPELLTHQIRGSSIRVGETCLWNLCV